MAQKIHRNKDDSLAKDPWKRHFGKCPLEEKYPFSKVPFGREVPFGEGISESSHCSLEQ